MILAPHNRGDLSAAQWKRIAPNLPPQKPAVGRPNNDHQTIINGILWVLLSRCSVAGYPGALWSKAKYLRTLLPSRGNRESGKGFYKHSNSKPRPKARSIGRSMESMGVSSEPHKAIASAKTALSSRESVRESG